MSDGGTAIREPQRGEVVVGERDDGSTKGLLSAYRQGKLSPVGRVST
jgi:hypothetical protein